MDQIEHCGPGVCFTMETMTPAETRRFMVQAALSTPYATRPSGDPRQARHSDQGVTVGWSPRQQAAARRLEELWVLSLKGYVGPQGTGSIGAGGDTMSEDDLKACGQAWKDYRDAMQAVEAQCSPNHAVALKLAVIEHQPSPLGRTGLVREALSFLADWWEIR